MNLHTAELNFIAHRFARFRIKMEQIVVNWLCVDKCTFDVQNPSYIAVENCLKYNFIKLSCN
jgi:hypothetical protein